LLHPAVLKIVASGSPLSDTADTNANLTLRGLKKDVSIPDAVIIVFRTNNNQEGETNHQYIQEHSETQNNNEGTVDNATMKHASDKNESEDEYYTNTEDDIPLVKL